VKDILVAQRGVRFQQLTLAQRQAIRDASLRLLETVGVEVHHERARKLLAEAGAGVEDTRVRVPKALVEHAEHAYEVLVAHWQPQRPAKRGDGSCRMAPRESL